MNRGLSDINSPQSKASNRRKRREKKEAFHDGRSKNFSRIGRGKGSHFRWSNESEIPGDASLISLVVSRSKTTVPLSLPRNSPLYLRRLTLFYCECNFRRDLPGMLREEGETDRTTD